MKIIAIALAGGKSLRMGSDKALLKIDGETLLARVCQVAAQVAESLYVVVRSCEQYQAAIADSENISMVLDQQLDGALVGFLQGLEAIAHASNSPDWVLLLACDLPNLDSEILRSWATQLADLPEDAIAYLPKYIAQDRQDQPANHLKSKQWEPLCGFYRWGCQKSLREFVENGGRSFQQWLNTQQVVEILEVDPNILFNCNTLDELLSLKQQNWR
ncbi:MAG: molybdenum cofactor guanylyltransferase [Pseudanabaena sp.]|nr:MAG: molybdenum cofactor guanylyltransferase [Pseudanabaena sp.]